MKDRTMIDNLLSKFVKKNDAQAMDAQLKVAHECQADWLAAEADKSPKLKKDALKQLISEAKTHIDEIDGTHWDGNMKTLDERLEKHQGLTAKIAHLTKLLEASDKEIAVHAESVHRKKLKFTQESTRYWMARLELFRQETLLPAMIEAATLARLCGYDAVPPVKAAIGDFAGLPELQQTPIYEAARVKAAEVGLRK